MNYNYVGDTHFPYWAWMKLLAKDVSSTGVVTESNISDLTTVCLDPG